MALCQMALCQMALCQMAFILSVAIKSIMLTVVMQNVVVLIVIRLSVVASLKCHIFHKFNLKTVIFWVFLFWEIFDDRIHFFQKSGWKWQFWSRHQFFLNSYIILENVLLWKTFILKGWKADFFQNHPSNASIVLF
jgi:hypothetical protein